MNFELLKLITLLLGEGSVNLRTIKFTNTSEELKQLFKNLAESQGYKVKIKDSKNQVIYSAKLAKILIEKCKNFRRRSFKESRREIYSVTTFPSEIFSLPLEKLKEILRIYFTCEGGVVVGSDVRNDEVIVRICHPILCEQFLELLDKVNIEAKVRGRGLIYIRKRSEIAKFAKEIGFIKGVKAVRGKHKGIEKNKLLMFVLSRH
ncbi:MAG: LAGLIDADG family homing endonuclease [Candidatus Anstonellales archaeon]